eukprot:TRINITY_DN4874_c0_g1_i1.p1 TRINITY_DN4874_c0_g1~~TRINITY_DN4874_c0_g1_i1.p1  ORF type:complete len:282 (-),score=65.05 TRINITY_DN4874_c0_g1_i1:291-1136(-)
MVNLIKSSETIFLVLKIVGLGVAALFWIIAMAGLSAAQDGCKDLFSDNTCYNAFRFEWFHLFFELFMIIGLALSFVLGTLKTFKTLFLSLFLILTVFAMQFADTSITQADQLDESEYDARAAGWVLLSMLNTCVVIYLSIDIEHIIETYALGEVLKKSQYVQRSSYEQEAANKYDVEVQDFSKVHTPPAAATTYPVQQQVTPKEESNPKPVPESLQVGPFVSNTLQDVDISAAAAADEDNKLAAEEKVEISTVDDDQPVAEEKFTATAVVQSHPTADDSSV